MDVVQLDREIRKLYLAANDMKQVIAACDALEREHENGDLSRALEAAIAVCYARPFGASNTIGGLGEEWRPAAGTAERDLHDALLVERNTVYAHTDKEANRLVLHAGELEAGFDGLVDMWVPAPRERNDRIRDLSRSLHERLMAESFRLQREILKQVHGDLPEPTTD